MKKNEKNGQCAVCLRYFTASASGIVAHHGFTRRHGWQHGRCFGAERLTWEVSPDAAREYADALERLAVDASERARALRAGEVRTLTVARAVSMPGEETTRTLSIGVTPLDTWTRAVDASARKAESDARDMREMRQTIVARVDAWKPRTMRDRPEETAPAITFERVVLEHADGAVRVNALRNGRFLGSMDSSGRVYANRKSAWKARAAFEQLRALTAACALRAE